MLAKNFEIYFSDLTDDAQKRFLEFLEIENASEANLDTFAITSVPFDAYGQFGE